MSTGSSCGNRATHALCWSSALMFYFSAAVSDSELIQAVKGLKVVDIGVKSFTLAWKERPGTSGYKISWTPFLGEMPHMQSIIPASRLIHSDPSTWLFPPQGGERKSHVVPSGSTTFTIQGLQESTAYKIQVASVVGSKEGSPVLVTARTCESCKPQTVRNSMTQVPYQYHKRGFIL